MMRPRFSIALLAGLAANPLSAQQSADSIPVDKHRPARLSEIVTTATRLSQPISTSPLAVTVVTRADLTTTSAPTVPNLLWRLPGFTMRDYQSSLLINSSRAVPSFRGLNGSTAGRTLVLLDGVPLNESFSGRLNWGRIPLSLVDRIEVVRGGGSMVWGSRALGGVINILTANPSRTGVEVLAEGGQYDTYRGALTANLRDAKLSASLSTDWSGTDGVLVLRKDQSGPIDIPDAGKQRVVFGKLAYDVTPNLKAYLAGNYMHGSGSGSTPVNESSQSIGELRGGLRLATPRRGAFDLGGYANDFDSSVLTSTVSTDRTSATPGRQTTIPAHSAGGSLQWSHQVLKRHYLALGFDLSRTSGTFSEDANFANGQMTLRRAIAGTQLLGGAFVQDNLSLSDRWRLLLGARLDRVQNSDGRRFDTDLVQGTSVRDTSYPRRTFSRLNYSLGVRHTANAVLDWRATLYGAFRAPTLYELYNTNYSSRGAVTAANPDLDPERLFGVELGADLSIGSGVLARVTGFWNRVHDPVVDYTIGTATTAGQVIEPCGALPKNQVCRQRRNVHSLRTVGIESEVEYHPLNTLSLWASYTFNPTRISAPEQEIDGKVARGAARHAASVVVTFDNPKWFAVALEQRYVGSRSDDDLDTIRLDSFLVTGVRLSRRLWAGSSAYLRVENLFDRNYPITRGSNGLEEVGAPRWVTAGLRAAW